MAKTVTTTKAAVALTSAGKDIRWSSETWKKTEARLNDFDLMVLKKLVCAVTGQIDDESVFTVMGEYLYQAVRCNLSNEKMQLIEISDSRSSTPSVTVKQGKNRKGGRKGGGAGGNKAKRGPTKAEQIRIQNSMGTLSTKIETAMNAFFSTGVSFTEPRLFIDKIVELRGVGFLCCVWYFLSKRKQLQWDSELTVLCFGVIVSLERFIKSVENLKGKSHLDSSKDDTVSSTLVLDLKGKLEEMKDKFTFTGEKLYLTAPQLLIFSKFDSALPVSSIKPYPHQARVCELLEQNIENGCYIMYRAVTNAGKTTTIAMLAAVVQKLRNTHKALENLQVIFCCNIDPVKNQAGQWLYNTSNINAINQLPFGIAFDRPDGTLVIRNSYMCQAKDDRRELPKNRLVILCSPVIAARVLKERSGQGPYILFHDEPTIGAEVEHSDEMYENVNLMMKPQRWIILSSATLPSEQDLGPFIRRFKNRYPNGVVADVSSSSVAVGCDIYSHAGKTFLPHIGCTSTETLERCVAQLQDNMFMSRSYTPLSVSEMCDLSQKHTIEGVPRIGEHFSRIENLSAEAVRRFGMDIVERVSKTDDVTATAFCSEEIKASSRSVDFTKLGTTEAHKFPQMSLVAASDPVKFVLTNFADLIAEINDTKTYTLKNLLGTYWRAYEQWASELDKVKKRSAKSLGTAPPKRRNSRGEVDKEEKVDYERQEMDLLTNKPFLSFPEYFQINTRLHAEKYSPNNKIATERFPAPLAFLTDQKTNMNVEENILLLLCCGVGVYAPKDPRVKGDSYINEIISLAQKGQLAYLVADENIAYGVNFPFSRTIVDEEFAATHSMNTVFQLMSRAGRVGQSWFAEAFIPNKTSQLLSESCHTNKPADQGVEISNILAAAKQIAQKEREDKLAREALLAAID